MGIGDIIRDVFEDDAKVSSAQNKLISYIAKGKSLKYAINNIDFKKKDVVSWYKRGSSENSKHSSFYKRLNNLMGDKLIDEDLETLSILIENNHKFFSNANNKELFHDKNVIASWYKLGRQGHDKFTPLYILVKKEAFEDIIEKDVSTIKSLLNDDVDLDVALNNDNLFTTREEFRIWFKESSDNNKLYKKINRNHGDEFKLKSQNVFLDYFLENGRIDDEIDGLYHPVFKIISWYNVGKYYKKDESGDNYLDNVFYKNFHSAMLNKTNFSKSENLLKKFDINKSLDENLKDCGVDKQNLSQWIELADRDFQPFSKFKTKFNKYVEQLEVINFIKENKEFGKSMPNFESAKGWYIRGSQNLDYNYFFKICKDLLINNTNFDNSKKLLKNLNINEDINNTLFSLNISLQDFNQWLFLGSLGFVPFKEFHDEYDVFFKKYYFIKSLKSSDSFNLNNSNFDEVKEWYYLGSGQNQDHEEFYSMVFDLVGDQLIKHDLDKIQKLADSGINFEESISNKELYHQEEKFISWYKEGEFNPKFNEVYELFNQKFKKDLIKHDINLIKNCLNQGLSFEESLNHEDLFCSASDLKTEFMELFNGSIFNEDEKKIIIKETKEHVLAAIEEGFEFNSLISDLYVNFDKIQEWYILGSRADEDNQSFFHDVSKILIKNTNFNLSNKVLDNLKSGIKLSDINIDGVSQSDISIWIKYGKSNLIPFQNFYKKFIEIIFIDSLKQNKTFDEAENSIKIHSIGNSMNEWYKKGQDGEVEYISFYNSCNDVLKNNTNFDEIKQTLNNIKPNEELYDNLSPENIENMNYLLELAKMDFKPFLEFFNDFNRYATQHSIINSLEKGSLFADAIKDNCSIYCEEDIKKWYDEKGIFYEICSDLTKEESQNIILDNLRKGLTFKESIEYIVLHDEDTINKWVELGNSGVKSFQSFSDSCNKLIEKNVQKRVIDKFKKGMLMEDILEDDDLEIDANKIKNWYELGREGDNKYINFYNESFEFIKDTLKEALILQLKSNNTFEATINGKLKFYNEDIKRIYALGSDKNSYYLDFYNSISPLIEDELKSKVLTELQNNIAFNNKFMIPGLEYCSNDVKKWCTLGSKGDIHHQKFFNNFYEIIQDELRKSILNEIKQGKTFDEAVNDSIFKDKIKSEYAFGKNGNVKYRSFYEDSNKFNFINVFKNKTFDDLLEAYNGAKSFFNDVEFRTTISNLIIKITDFNKSDKLLKNTDLYTSINTNDKNVNLWIELGQDGFEPFDKFYNKYLIHEDQYLIVSNLKKGKYLDEIISEVTLNHNFNDIKQWFDFGKIGKSEFKEFYDIASLLMIKDSQKIVLNNLELGMSFEEAISQKDLFHTTDEINEWYTGDKRKTDYFDFYNACLKFMEDSYQDKVICFLNEGKTFDEAVSQRDLRPFAEDIKQWFKMGIDKESNYNSFHNSVEKISIINALKDKNDPIKLIDAYSAFMEYYTKDNKFKEDIDTLLIQNTVFNNSKSISNKFSFNKLYSLKKFTNPYYWFKLGEKGLDPFVDFYNSYLLYLNQFEVISSLESGNYLSDIKKKDIDKSTIENWYNLGKQGKDFINFYNVAKPLLEKDSQKLIINNMENGMSFDDAISQDNLYHTVDDINRWFILGSKGNEKYVEFFKISQNYQIKETMELILSKLDKGMSFDDAISQGDLNFESKTIKEWYNHGMNGILFYKKFFEEVSKKIFVNLLKKGNKFFDALKLFNSPKTESKIITWYRNGSNNIVGDLDFYNASRELLIKNHYFNNYESIFEELDSNLSLDFNESKIKEWAELGKLKIKPFDEFYDKYKVFETQLLIVNLITTKKISFYEVLDDEKLVFSKEDILKWFNLGKNNVKYVGFYNLIKDVSKVNSQEIVIKNLNNGLLFEDAISDENLIHSPEEIKMWYNSGRNRNKEYVAFYQKVKQLIKHESQNKVVEGLEKGLSFDAAISQKDLYHNSVEINKWYMLGLKGNKKYEQFFLDCKKFLEKDTIDIVLSNLDKGLSFDKAISQNNLYHSQNEIKQWYEQGLDGKNEYRTFSNKVSKFLFMYGADHNEQIDELFNKFDFKHIVSWFKEDKTFYDKYISLLEEFTNFDTVDNVLNELNPLVLFNFEENESVKKWIELADFEIEPFVVFHNVYYEYLSQYRIIKAIKDGKSFKEAITQKNLFYSIFEIRNWVMGATRFKEFVSFCAPYVEKTSQDIVLEGLKGGLSFSTAISQNKVYHSSDEIKEWYILGREGIDEYENFYNELSKFVLKEECDKVLEFIKSGLSFNQAISNFNLMSSKEEFKACLDEGKLGNSDYVDFYNQCKLGIEKDTQKLILNECSKNISFDEAINNLNLNVSVADVKEWYNLGKNGNDDYIDFYNGLHHHILRDDLKTVLEDIKVGKSLNESLDNLALYSSKEDILNAYNNSNSDKNIKKIVADTIEYLKLNTQYDKADEILESFDLMNPNFSESKIINNWIDLGKLDIEPFYTFYDKFSILQAQVKIIEALKRGSSFKDVLYKENLGYDVAEIKEWYLKGKQDIVYQDFYKFTSEIIVNETKKEVIDSLKEGYSFDIAIQKNNEFITSNQIKEWYDLGNDGDETHRAFYLGCNDLINKYDKIDSVDQLFKKKYVNKINSKEFSLDDYSAIIDEISKTVKDSSNINQDDLILNRIGDIVSLYGSWGYESEDNYKFIEISKYANVSDNIITLIKGLSSLIVFEIIEKMVCFLFDVFKSEVTEKFTNFILDEIEMDILNKYCGFIIQEKLIPITLKEYNLFNNSLKNYELDENNLEDIFTESCILAKDIYLIFINLFNNDLIKDIKSQYAEDYANSNYEVVDLEIYDKFSKQIAISNIHEFIVDKYNKALESENIRESI